MKLVWSPETASKAYIATVKRARESSNPGDAEFLAAMAAGYNAKLIVEVRRGGGGSIATSVGLAVAAGHTRGRHVCVVPDEDARRDYVNAMQEAVDDVALPEVVVVGGDLARAVDALEGVDFLVVQGKYNSREVFSRAKLSRRGAVLVHKGGASSRFSWRGVVDGNKLRVVKSVSLPLDKGLEIAYVAGNDGKTLKSPKGEKRWIRHIDQSGEEHMFRR